MHALAAAGLLSAQAHAGQAQAESLQALPVAAFSQTDINAMFEQAGQPMELAALSQLEMKETEGAAVPLFWAAGTVLVRGSAHFVPRAVISSRQATTIARNGGQVFSNNARAAQQVANNAYGRGNVAFHNAHQTSPIFRPHFQPTNRAGNNSHIFLRR